MGRTGSIANACTMPKKGNGNMARILIVDDEPKIAMLARMILEKEGYEVDEVENGKACLDRLKEEKYDLVLLDVMMPKGINGWEVCRKIKTDEKTKDTPVVMFTVRTSDDSLEKGIRAGADAQIDKPFGKEEIRETVVRVLKGS